MEVQTDMEAHPYRRVWDTHDLERWGAALSPDVVLHSPVISKPFRGRDAAVELFEVLFDALGEFEITAEFTNAQDGSHVFFWRALAAGKAIEGTDLIRHDTHGGICEVRVLIRPLVSVVAFAAAIGPPLAARRGRLRGRVTRLMTIPLIAIVAVADVVASRLTQDR